MSFPWRYVLTYDLLAVVLTVNPCEYETDMTSGKRFSSLRADFVGMVKDVSLVTW